MRNPEPYHSLRPTHGDDQDDHIQEQLALKGNKPRITETKRLITSQEQSEPEDQGILQHDGKTDGTFRPCPILLSDGEGSVGSLSSRKTQEDILERTKSSIQGWIFEIISLLAMWGALAGLIGILLTYQDHPTDDWPSRLPAPNTTVAGFMTIIKSLCLFIVAKCLSQMKWTHHMTASTLRDFRIHDEASRGPLGAIKLLYYSRFRLRWAVAILGALITLSTLGIDALAQGLIKSDTIVEMPRGSLNTTDRWMGGKALINQDIADWWQYDTAMEAAIYRGLYGQKTSGHECNSTSRCLWRGSYSSLAVRSRCDDVTRESLEAAVIKKGLLSKIDNSTRYDQINFRTPNNVSLNYTKYPFFNNVVAVYGEDTHQMPATSNGYNPLSLTADTIDFDTPFEPVFARLAFLQVFAPMSASYEVTELEVNNTSIYDCSLEFVSRTYQNVYTEGQLNLQGKIHDRPLKPAKAKNFTKGPYGSNDDYVAFPVLQFEVDDEVSEKNGQRNTEYTVQLANWMLLGAFFPAVFFGEQYVLDGGLTKQQEDLFQETSIPVGVANLFAEGNEGFSRVMGRVALSITHEMQSRKYDRNSSQFRPTGVTDDFDPNLRIEWAWISAPIFLIASTSVLLVVLILTTGHIVLWKSSATALLYHEVSGPAEDLSVATLRCQVGDLTEMEEREKGVKMRVAG